ncbi:hypothetical protein [Nocardia wallacei]|nr:hypothetical protein [Nocardia wallacei]
MSDPARTVVRVVVSLIAVLTVTATAFVVLGAVGLLGTLTGWY